MRLIDADALMGVFRARMVERNDREKCASDENCKVCEPGCFWRRAILAAPAVDAVPVVLCRECKWFKPYQKPVEDFDGRCVVHMFETDDEEFCSIGRRKDNDTTRNT